MKKEYFFVFFVFLSVLMLPALLLGYSETFVAHLSPGSDELVHEVVSFLKFNGELSDEFTSDMQSHFHDVRLVMLFGWVFVLFTAGSLFYFDVMKKTVLLRSGILVFGFLFLVGFWVLIDFDSFFTVFHMVLFPQGNWQFPSDSIIITLFPQEFFVTSTLLSVGSSLLISVLLILLGLFGYDKSAC